MYVGGLEFAMFKRKARNIKFLKRLQKQKTFGLVTIYLLIQD